MIAVLATLALVAAPTYELSPAPAPTPNIETYIAAGGRVYVRPISIAATPSPSPSPTPTPGPIYAEDWSSQIDACYTMEASDFADDCSGGDDGDLTGVNSPTFSSTGGIDGVYAEFDGSTEYAYDADDEAMFAVTGSTPGLTQWCFVYNPTDPLGSDRGIIGKSDGGNDGYQLEIESGNGEDYRSVIENRSSITSGGQWAEDRWTFAFLRAHDGTASGRTQIEIWHGASGSANNSNNSSYTLSDDPANFALAIINQASPGNYMEGRLDRCGFDTSNITDAGLCRICACGEDGKGCTCDGDTVTYLTTGLRDTDCGGCTMTGCNVATMPTL